MRTPFTQNDVINTAVITAMTDLVNALNTGALHVSDLSMVSRTGDDGDIDVTLATDVCVAGKRKEKT